MAGEVVAKQRCGSGLVRYWAGVYREAYSNDLLVAWKVVRGVRHEWSQQPGDTPQEFHARVQGEISAYFNGHGKLP